MAHVRVNGLVTAVGDDVNSCASEIRQVGADMFAHLRGLVSSGQLSGEGIRQALEQSHTRWNSACDEFAIAEEKFGTQCHDTYSNTMASDHRAAGFF